MLAAGTNLNVLVALTSSQQWAADAGCVHACLQLANSLKAWAASRNSSRAAALLDHRPSLVLYVLRKSGGPCQKRSQLPPLYRLATERPALSDSPVMSNDGSISATHSHRISEVGLLPTRFWLSVSALSGHCLRIHVLDLRSGAYCCTPACRCTSGT